MGQSASLIEFIALVDSTVVFNLWQIIPSHGKFIGGNYLNHFLTVADKSDEDFLL